MNQDKKNFILSYKVQKKSVIWDNFKHIGLSEIKFRVQI